MLFSQPVFAAPGDVLFSDDFESGFGSWTENSFDGGDASIGTETSNSPNSSMRLRWEGVMATSATINAAVPAAELSVWIRRGDDAFSENPDANEDLTVEYLDTGNNWVTLETFDGDGTAGEILTRVYTLPGDALHSSLQVRFTLVEGSGSDFDYWHVDDVVITETAPPPPLAYGTCDDFENGFGNWTASGSGDASVGSETSNSPNNSMRLRWDTVTATSLTIDMDQPIGILEVWVRRGDNTFSERPEGNENLVLEYLNSSNNWVALETFSGGGPQGEIFDRRYTLPANALHSNFRLRFRLLSGSGFDFDYWHVDDVCLIDPLESAYHMDEANWDGTSDEVEDSGDNGQHGTAVNGADTDNADPAIAGSPGTCSYGTFDGTDDYVQVNNLLDILNGTASLAFWINTTQTGNNTGWQAPGVTGVEEAGGADDIFWGWLDASGRIGISVANDFTSKSTVTINDGTWHHVVLTRNASTGGYQIFIDGSLNTSGTIAAGVIGNTYSSIGRIEDTGGSPEYFNGRLDEVRIYNEVLNATAASRIMNLPRPCPTIGPDHYAISHDGTGVTCLADEVTITGHAIDHSSVDAGTVTLNLSTTTGRGDWGAVVVGGGSFNNGSQGDGQASYTFPGGETSVTLAFNYKNILAGDSESFFFDVTDGTATDLGDGNAEDPEMTFARTGFRFLNATDANSIIPTQIAGKPSDVVPDAKNISLQAIRSSDEDPSVCEPAFPAGTDKSIELAAECRNPPACAGNQVDINGNSVTTNNDDAAAGTGSYTPVTLTFGADSAAPLVLEYFDAGLMQLHARFNIPLEDGTPSGDFMLGSSNDFVVRPFGFDIAVNGNPGATDASGGILGAAGTDFDVTATAVVWQQADDGDNDGIPDGHQTGDTDAGNNAGLSDNNATPNYSQESPAATATLTARLDQPSGGVSGTLSGGTGVSGFSGGSATTILQYDEVGIIELRADTPDYLAGGQDVTGLSGHVGRFTPDRLDVTANTPVFADGCGAGDFTYQDQNFYHETAPVLTVTALNTAGDTTANYGGSDPERFWKLATDLAGRSYTDQAGAAAIFVAETLSSVALAGDTDFDGQGILSLVDGMAGDVFRYGRDTPEAPFDADADATFTAADLTDTDNVCYDPAEDGTCEAFTIENIIGTELRFGRLRMNNAAGSELLALPVPMQAEYFDSGAFTLNQEDTCTAIAATDLSLTSGVESDQTDGDVDVSDAPDCASGITTATIANNPFSAGEAGLSFSAAGESCVGDVDIDVDLDALGLGYLRFDWDGVDQDSDGELYDDSPSARASFGVFTRQREFIYTREPW